MKNPLVSIIIPVYNVENYLDRAINSIKAQKYQNYEVLMVDDGSTDNSLSILEEYAATDQRVRVFTKRNGGAGSARNLGLDNANGKYIYFMDPDDEILPELLSDNVSLIERYQSDLIMFDLISNKLDGKTMRHHIPDKILYLSGKQFRSQITNFFKPFSFYSPVNKLYLTDKIQSNGIRFNDYSVSEDAIFNMEYCRCIDSVVLNPNYYYVYWERENSLTHDFSKRCIINQFKVYKQFKDFLVECGSDGSFADREIISYVYDLRNSVDKLILRKMFAYVSKNCHKNIKDRIKLILTLPKLL